MVIICHDIDVIVVVGITGGDEEAMRCGSA